MSKPEPNDASDSRISASLAGRLKALGGPRVLVSPQTDELILTQAREHLAGVRRVRRVILFPRWLAAAAVVLLCAWLGYVWSWSPPPAPRAREDINRDNRVDILDAFAVARRLQQGPGAERVFDINGDGTADQRDIDAIAARAVRLEKPRG